MKTAVSIIGAIIDLPAMAADFIASACVAPMDNLGDQLKTRMKGYCPIGVTGNLNHSIDKKVVSFDNKEAGRPSRIAVIVGPARRKAGKPTRYAHSVEFGHRASGWHKDNGGANVPAHPFVRPTAAVARSTALSTLGPGVADALNVSVTRARGRKDIKLIKTFYRK